MHYMAQHVAIVCLLNYTFSSLLKWPYKQLKFSVWEMGATSFDNRYIYEVIYGRFTNKLRNVLNLQTNITPESKFIWWVVKRREGNEKQKDLGRTPKFIELYNSLGIPNSNQCSVVGKICKMVSLQKRNSRDKE